MIEVVVAMSWAGGVVLVSRLRWEGEGEREEEGVGG